MTCVAARAKGFCSMWKHWQVGADDPRGSAETINTVGVGGTANP